MPENQGNNHDKSKPLQVNDAIYSSILANIGDVIGIMGADGITKYKSPNIERLFGWKPEDLVGTEGWETVHPDDLERIKKEFYELLKEFNSVVTVEYRYKCKDGSYIWVNLTAANCLNVEAINGILLNYHDVSDRKRAELDLQESENKLQHLIQNLNSGVVVHAPDTQIILANSKASELLGLTIEQMKGKVAIDPDWCFVHEDGTPFSVEEYPVSRVFSTLKPIHNLVVGIQRPSTNDLVWVLVNAYPEFETGRQIRQVVVTFVDISERIKAVEKLRINESRTAAYLQNSPACTKVLDLDFNLQFMSRAGVEALNIEDVNEFYGKPYPFSFYPQSFKDEMTGNLKKALKSGEIIEQEAPVDDIDGNTLWFHSTITPVKGADGQIEYIMVVSIETTERKNAKIALDAEKERLAVTLRSIGDGVITTDVKGNIVMLNKEAEKMTGWKSSEAIGRPLPEVFNIINETTRQICENPVERVLKTSDIIELANHTSLITKDGQEIVIADSGAPIRDNESQIIGVVLVFRDMTEKQKLDEFMQKSQKLESLGVLAGGIAHDFNNILTGIFGNIELASEKTTQKDVLSHLSSSLRNIDRARALTLQLLTFAKGGAPIKKIENLFPFVQQTVQFALSGSTVSSRFHIQENLWYCDFDKNQIGQVIDNLIINAQQAMPNGGTIEVFARNITLFPNEHISLPAGDYIKLSIKDQGIGIPKEYMPRIFDPYYTTKSKGHGLGLSTCYSIINRHEGCIDIESEPGKGSSFHIYLPASTESSLRPVKPSKQEHLGKGTILVMDDDEMIRDIIESILESFGYSVVLTDNGKDAVEFFAKEIKENRVLAGMIFDLTIPGGMGGKEAIGKIRKICSETPVFVASGYSIDPIMANPENYGFTASIGKPFMKQELAEMLEKHLNEM